MGSCFCYSQFRWAWSSRVGKFRDNSDTRFLQIVVPKQIALAQSPPSLSLSRKQGVLQRMAAQIPRQSCGNSSNSHNLLQTKTCNLPLPYKVASPSQQPLPKLERPWTIMKPPQLILTCALESKIQQFKNVWKRVHRVHRLALPLICRRSVKLLVTRSRWITERHTLS